MNWSRQDYIDTAIARGLPRDRAEELADGLMRAHERVRQGAPGWERLCMETPQAVINRYGTIFISTVASNPTPSVSGQVQSGNAAVFAYGVMVGMLLAEHGIVPSQREREAAQENLTEVFDWIEVLRTEQE